MPTVVYDVVDYQHKMNIDAGVNVSLLAENIVTVIDIHISRNSFFSACMPKPVQQRDIFMSVHSLGTWLTETCTCDLFLPFSSRICLILSYSLALSVNAGSG